MKFEEEVKQVKFKNPYAKATLNIIYTGNWLRDKTEAILKPHKINEQHYNILRILRDKYPEKICPREIKEVLINNRGDLTRLLDKLVIMKLVQRDINLENRRMINLNITEEGLNLLGNLEPGFNSFGKMSERLTSEEACLLSDLLDKMRG